MSNYRVALIGCGWVSGEHIRAYKNNPQTEVAALVSYPMEDAQAKAKECKLDVPCFDSHEKMLQEIKPDIVSVTSPPHVHVEQAIAVMESGAQLILEKPPAMNSAELAKLLQAVRTHKTKTIVSFVLRWNPLFNVIRSVIDDDALGEIYYGEVDYYHGIGPWYKQFEWNVTKKSGGSSLLSAGCHAVDALVWFMGSRVTELYTCGARSKAKDFQPYEYDPTLVTLCKFEDGRVGKVTSSIECKGPYQFPIRLFGSKGTLRDNNLYSEKFPGQTGFATIPTILPDSGDVSHHPFQGEINHFVECLDKGVESPVNIEYAAHIMQICYAAEESARTGQPVKLGEI